jgi:hypothetical protein
MRRSRANVENGNDDATSEKKTTTGGVDLGRRSYLKLVGGAAVAAASPLVGTASAATVDLGAEGLAPGDEIDAYLEEHFVSGAEVHIPPGEYRWNGGGLGGSYRDATLVGDGDVVFRIADGATHRPNILGTGGRTIIANITVRGVQGDGRIRVDARDPDAHVVLHNVDLPDGGEDMNGAIGFFVGTEHAGTATFHDCVVVGFPNNGIYASAPGKDGNGDGQVRVVGGLYRNNNIANVRVGSTNSVVRDAVLVQDGAAPRYTSGARNQRGLWVRSGGTSLTLEDNDITHTYGGANSPIMLQARGGGGGGVVRDTRIRNDNDDAAVRGATGDWSGAALHITGSGDDSVPSGFGGACTENGCEEPATTPREPVALNIPTDGA